MIARLHMADITYGTNRVRDYLRDNGYLSKKLQLSVSLLLPHRR